jgi:hypothetical protein
MEFFEYFSDMFMNTMCTGLALAIHPPLWLLGNPPRDKQTWERFLGVSLIKTSEGKFSITLVHIPSGIIVGCFFGGQHQFPLW